MVLMIVRMLIGLSAGAMRACSLLPESSHVPSATLSDERQVRRRVHTRHRSDRERCGAVVSTSRQQETDDDQRRRSAE